MFEKNELFLIVVDSDDAEQQQYVARIDIRAFPESNLFNENMCYCRAICSTERGILFKRSVADGIVTLLKESSNLEYTLEKVEFEAI